MMKRGMSLVGDSQLHIVFLGVTCLPKLSALKVSAGMLPYTARAPGSSGLAITSSPALISILKASLDPRTTWALNYILKINKILKIQIVELRHKMLLVVRGESFFVFLGKSSLGMCSPYVFGVAG